ncbi:MAG: MFS transporter [Acidimicrobiia bacterium]|nr:MFS transporter [Acidimicrobiia bacterium]
MSSARTLLRDRRLALLVAGQAANAIGSWCALVAVWGYASFHFHASASDLALLGVSWALPMVLLGPVAGIPVDRFGPKRVLVVADSIAAGVTLLFILAGSFEVLLLLGAIEGCTKAFAEPAFQSLPPRLVDDEHLAAANGLLGMAFQSAIALGPLLAAGSIGAFGFSGAFVVNSLTYLIGVGVLLPFHLGAAAPSAKTEPSRLRDEMREGFAVVAARPSLRRGLALATSVYLIWGAFIVIEPIYVRSVLHGTPTMFAYLQATFGIALVGSGLFVTGLGDRAAKWWVVSAAAMGSGLGAAIYVGSRQLVIAYVGISIWGIATAFLLAPLRTLVQRASPIETHGRVFALDGMLHNSADLVALTVVALAAGAWGVQSAALGMALVPVTGGILMLGAIRRGRMPIDPDPRLEPAAA